MVGIIKKMSQCLFSLFVCIVILNGCSQRPESSLNFDYSSTYQPVQSNPLPKVNTKSEILGLSYTTFKAMGLSNYPWDMEIDDPKRMFLAFDLDPLLEEGIEYYYVNMNDYVGVKNDKIVCAIQYGNPMTMRVNDWLIDPCFYSVEPKIVYTRQSEAVLGWKLDNGYLFVNALVNNYTGAWYNYYCKWVISVESFEHSLIDWE